MYLGFKSKAKALQESSKKYRRSLAGSPSHLGVFAWSWQGLIALPLPAKNPPKCLGATLPTPSRKANSKSLGFLKKAKEQTFGIKK